MQVDEQKLDFTQIVENLLDEFPEIEELYLFGSRRFGTKSVRSDIDILVVHSNHIRPNELRNFVNQNCKALDLFLVKGAKAVSTQNESYVEANNFNDLIKVLSAVRFWSKKEGRLNVPIDWKFKIRTDINFVATSLPNTHISSEKSMPIDIEKLTIGKIISSLTLKQIGMIMGILVAVFSGGYWLSEKINSINKPVISKKVHQDTIKLPNSN